MKREKILPAEWANGCLDDYPGGYVIRCDKHGQNFASADIARIRLDGIVAIDRQAVPCGRWVPVRDACVAVDRWQYQNYMRRAFGLKELPPLPSREVLPRYRWSERR